MERDEQTKRDKGPKTEEAPSDAKTGDSEEESEESKGVAALTPTASSDNDESPIKNPKKLHRRGSSSFMRAGDLNICRSLALPPDLVHDVGLPVDEGANELWIALDGERSAEVVPLVVKEMARFSIELIDDCDLWKPDKKTDKILKKDDSWVTNDKDVLLWSGKFSHGGYGSEIPCVKSRGLVNMRPHDLAEVLMDSSRVQSYNKMSQGRTDELILQTSIDTADGPYGRGETKTIRSTNKPPLVRTALEFVSLLHGRKLDAENGEGNGYIVVGRSISRTEDSNKVKTVRNEILLNVHLLLEVEASESQTEMININHLKSSMVPMLVAKKVGLSSAVTFINDIRSLC